SDVPPAHQQVGSAAGVAEEGFAAADWQIVDQGADEALARIVEGVPSVGRNVKNVVDVAAVVALSANGNGRIRRRAQRVGFVPSQGVAVVEAEPLREASVQFHAERIIFVARRIVASQDLGEVGELQVLLAKHGGGGQGGVSVH